MLTGDEGPPASQDVVEDSEALLGSDPSEET